MISAEELLQFTLFNTLESKDLEPLLPHFTRRKYRKGQILFVEGEVGSNVYFVMSGQVKLGKTLPDGSEQILDLCSKGDSFAEVLLLEQGAYPVTAEVIQNSILLVFNNQFMTEILERHPVLSVALIRTLSRRLRMCQEFIRILTSRSTSGVLAALLLRLARPSEPGKPIYVDAALTHRELASMIGTSREYVNRAINNWKKLGILQLSNNRLEILDPYELADWP